MFNPEKFVANSVSEIKKTVGSEKAITALSGGVDSFVAATLTSRAIPSQLKVVYVNTGLMRKGETEQVQKTAKNVGMPLTVIDAKNKFLSALIGIGDPEQKRKIIGELFCANIRAGGKKLWCNLSHTRDNRTGLDRERRTWPGYDKKPS